MQFVDLTALFSGEVAEIVARAEDIPLPRMMKHSVVGTSLSGLMYSCNPKQGTWVLGPGTSDLLVSANLFICHVAICSIVYDPAARL